MSPSIDNDESSHRTLLLFGSQALSFDEAYFERIRLNVVGDKDNRWMIDVVEDLSTYWNELCEIIPSLRSLPGERWLKQHTHWLQHGSKEDQRPSQLPNIILSPLVIMGHLSEYVQHSAASGEGFQSEEAEYQRANTETLGFCIGLLSAFAVSSSSTRAQFCQNGAAAIRLAMVVGGLVDAQMAESESVSLTATWKSEQGATKLNEVLENFPDTYISVSYDENRATVTTAKSTVSTLQGKLGEAGINTNEIGLQGRFHTPMHEGDMRAVLRFCEAHPGFRLPDASKLTIPTRSNSGGRLITQGNLHEIALREILVDHCDWISSFRNASSASLTKAGSQLVVFGSQRCIPQSIQRSISAHVTYVDANSVQNPETTVRDDDIAVVGMSCNLAGASDVDQFWKILMDGESQHKEVPTDRFTFETVFRQENDPNRKWYGNFIDDYDAFDHKFFKKTPREATSMDPQQRLLYQASYQAVAQSGYFQKPLTSLDTKVGCYIGVCATDYETNIAHYPANAFSATGNLRSFIAGKISHYFGWTGPGLTIDTACSASAVAIHHACQAILTGECTAALAGGTNFISSPLWYQNLAGASFLSTTGQCKPFDAKADGYCRGEAIATVFLKKMSQAIADGDQIFGSISATGVFQNQNCTPIFVPNAPSLSDLFNTVLERSGIESKQITYVEAHGTGTPVGDPAEYESIRTVFGGRTGQVPLQFGSVKGLIGHTEGSSGVVSLIKVLLMMNEGYIPPQASHSAMNPGIKVSQSDNMTITTKPLPWESSFKAALINNYGASGSNASMIVKQAPRLGSKAITGAEAFKAPFYISGFDEKSLRAYVTRLRHFLKTRIASGTKIGLEDLAFNIARQSNWSLESALIFSCQSIDEFDDKLAAFESGNSKMASVTPPAPRPVILCFGGQISTFVGLDREVYENVKVLRKYLDNCDAVCRSIGAGSIYPGIFQREPIADVSKLQSMLFAIQYSCAMSWIESGIRPTAVVGHSFGELTALCVSGALSIRDTLKMIVGRAKLIKDRWGQEKGAMMAVEADREVVDRLLVESHSPVTIACFNGPRSFTLAGSSDSIDDLVKYMSSHQTYSSMKFKKLNVTNAFHSTLVEHLKPELEQVGKDLTFLEPTIPLERATEYKNTDKFTPSYVADHMRNPVYFDHAVHRLSRQYPSAIWLEAGSNSTITTMAGRALSTPKGSSFQPVNITSGQGLQQLTDTTLGLWSAGLRVSFWAHSKSQTGQYTPILLPPYQFDKQRHWLAFKVPPKYGEIDSSLQGEQGAKGDELPTTLFSFLGYRDNSQDHPRFRINTMIPKYEDIVSGHVIAKTAPICPATLQVDLAIEAILSIQPELREKNMHPQICNVTNQSPICINPARSVFLNFARIGNNAPVWNFEIVSSDDKPGETTHVTGEVRFLSANDSQYRLEFNRFERLVNHQRCRRILSCDDGDDVIQGRSIYKVFSEVVDYGKEFFGLQKLVGRAYESAGRVVKKHSGETWLDPFLGDCFSQVGGIWVNCIANQSSKDMYIANGFEQWMRSPKILKYEGGGPYDEQEEWHVLANHKESACGNAFVTDIFIFDANNGDLVEVILGVNYAKVPLASMSKLLTRLTPSLANLRGDSKEKSKGQSHAEQQPEGFNDSEPTQAVQIPKRAKGNSKAAHLAKLKAVLADITGLEPEEIADDVDLGDIGIDSLMGMEMAREVEQTFNCTLDVDELMNVTDMPSLFRCLLTALGESDDGESDTSGDQTSGENSASSKDTPPSSNATSIHTHEDAPISKGESNSQNDTAVKLPQSVVLEAFGESKLRTDHLIQDHRCSGYMHNILPHQTKLCIQLTVEAFRELGCDLATARPGQELERIPFEPRHNRLQIYLYQMLEETRIIDLDGDRITRTGLPLPTKTSDELLADLVRNYPDHTYANQLAHWTGSKLAEVLRGNEDGIKLIFGNERGRELVAGLYGDTQLNKLSYMQMNDFLGRIVAKLSEIGQDGTLRILEMGAGTGGTTKWLVPMLAKLGFPIEYTFTDLAPSFVAAARKKYKEYPFMKFAVHDIEKPPADANLIGSQHIVIASNAVHATHSLTVSAGNIRKFLRPDGLLMMLEMTHTVYWVDMIFGILEGWWLFDDGRAHALSDEYRWERDLHSVGYGHVDWADGESPETDVQKVIIALASGPQLDRLPAASSPATSAPAMNLESRKADVEAYVKKASEGFHIPEYSGPLIKSSCNENAVLVTGATGSLGCHLVTHFASLPNVQTVYCINRRSKQDPVARQIAALESKGIVPDAFSLSKLKVFETSTSQPLLGLPQDQYQSMVKSVTHIVHNAWPMNSKKPIKGFESQFQVLRNLIDLAAEASSRRGPEFKVSFQFISSIGTVGHYPLHKHTPHIPEERMQIDSVLPNGYGDAKYACERILDETLHTRPDLFRPMVVRPGQVAGSSISGYWNHVEHLSFLIKSAQTLRALPDFDGPLSWTPVNDVAGTLADLLLNDNVPHPVYHIENPVRQPWKETIPVLADALGIPRDRIIPYKEWIQRVRYFPGKAEWDNPAWLLVDFLEYDFERMSCGGVLLGTEKTLSHSATFRGVGPVSPDVVHKYVHAWKESGFLR